jgi:hypothetical protein
MSEGGEIFGPKKDYTKIGEITIVVFKDGRCPARVEGINEPLLIKVLAANIARIAVEVRRAGGVEEFVTLQAHCIGINKIADLLSEKLSKEKPLIVKPDIIGGKFS